MPILKTCRLEAADVFMDRYYFKTLNLSDRTMNQECHPSNRTL